MNSLTTVKEIRASVVAFLQGKENVPLSDIKAHLGLEPMIYSQRLHDALRTVKIRQKKAWVQVSEIRGKPIYLGTPITLYSDALLTTTPPAKA